MFMFNMKDFDHHKFTKTILYVAWSKVELELMDPDEDSDSNMGE